jgi:hypothetical protein
MFSSLVAYNNSKHNEQFSDSEFVTLCMLDMAESFHRGKPEQWLRTTDCA